MAGDQMFGFHRKDGMYIGITAKNVYVGTNVYGAPSVAPVLRWIKSQASRTHRSQLHLEGPAYDEQAVADFIGSDDMFERLYVNTAHESMSRAVCVGLWHARMIRDIELMSYGGPDLVTFFHHCVLAMRLNPNIREINPRLYSPITRAVLHECNKEAYELGHPTMQDVCWYWLLDPRRPALTVKNNS